MQKLIVLFCAVALLASVAGGTANSVQTIPGGSAASAEGILADGVYTVDVTTDGGMFRPNEALEGKGTLTVEDGQMTAHITLSGTGFSKLFPGSAEEAKKEGAAVIDAVKDSVTYPDGFADTANGFDIPIAALDEDLPFAAMGKKSGSWFDHTIRIRSEERRVGKECRIGCRSRWSPYH